MIRWLFLVLTMLAVAGAARPAPADTVEFLSGTKLEGTVKEIRKTDQEFDFEAQVGTRAIVRTYPFNQVHAVTMKGRRFTLNPMPENTVDKNDSNRKVLRSKTEVEELIRTVGASLPDWYESTKLDYPQTLDLSWPLKPPTKGWNNRKNMGQYIWDVIHPNPSRWRSGIKLIHHCMTLHENNATLLQRDQKTVARMYFELLQDYPRAAYWFRKAKVTKGEPPSVMLAECYWRMGNKQMAMQQMASRSVVGGGKAVKLYGNMGEITRALKLTEAIARTSQPYVGFIAAGDALRQAGQFDQAIVYYRKVLSASGYRNKDYEDRFKSRARESIEAIELFEKVDVSRVPDGAYQGNSTGYNGRMDIEVKVTGGEIKSVKVTQHREKQFYSALTDTENQILERQTVRGVDGTTGATITSRAIVNAAAKALAGQGR